MGAELSPGSLNLVISVGGRGHQQAGKNKLDGRIRIIFHYLRFAPLPVSNPATLRITAAKASVETDFRALWRTPHSPPSTRRNTRSISRSIRAEDSMPRLNREMAKMDTAKPPLLAVTFQQARPKLASSKTPRWITTKPCATLDR